MSSHGSVPFLETSHHGTAHRHGLLERGQLLPSPVELDVFLERQQILPLQHYIRESTSGNRY
jgi:hypothetical protein